MEKARQDFPGGAVDKNPPANAWDTGWIPVQEDSTHCGATKLVHHNSWAHALEPFKAQLLSLCSETEKSLQWEAHASQL